MIDLGLKESEKDGVTVIRGFACCCGEGQKHMDELQEEVRRRLGDGSDELMARDIHYIATDVVISLNWDFHAHITGIDNDQWSAVSAETYSVGERSYKNEPKVRVYMQCDRVEDGFAAIWKVFADRFPERLHDAEEGEGTDASNEGEGR